MPLRINRLRTPQFARRKRRIFYAKAALGALSVLALVSGGMYLLRLDTLRISDVFVEGSAVIPAETLAAAVEAELAGNYLGVVPKSNTLFYPRRKIEESLRESFARLKSADLSRAGFATLKLSVTEREPAALWCGENRLGEEGTPICYLLDESGFIYGEAPTFTGMVYVRFYGPLASGDPIGRHFFSEDEFRKLLAFIAGIRGTGVSPTELAVRDEEDYDLYLDDGSRLVFGKNQDLGVVLDNFRSALELQEFKGKTELGLDYLDLRFGNKVYYKTRE